MLLPYARAIVHAHRMDVPLLQPTWWRPRLGRALRREHDRRAYHPLVEKPSVADQLCTRLTLVGHAWCDDSGQLIRRGMLGLRGTVLITRGMQGMFGPLLEHRDLVGDGLRRLFRPALTQWSRERRPYAAMHVRLGDFRPHQTSAAVGRPITNTSTPLEWFVGCAMTLRDLYPTLPIVVASDGTDEELSELLKIPGVRRTPPASAAADLWTLAGAVVLAASGSTFSAWASYLGAMPTLVHPLFGYCLPDADWVAPAATSQFGEKLVPLAPVIERLLAYDIGREDAKAGSPNCAR